MSRDLVRTFLMTRGLTRSNLGAMADSVDYCVGEITTRYPEIDPDIEGCVDRLSTINKHASRIFEKTLSAHGLTHGEYRMLLRLATRTQDRRMSAGHLAKLLMLSSGAMTARLDKMEKAGQVRRCPDPDDRRGVIVELTDAGEALLDQAVIASAREDAVMMSGLSAQERNQLNGLLAKLLESMEARRSEHENAEAEVTAIRAVAD